jgi:hypothetical protein
MTHANAAWTGMLPIEDTAPASNHSHLLRKDFRATAAPYHQEGPSSR